MVDSAGLSEWAFKPTDRNSELLESLCGKMKNLASAGGILGPLGLGLGFCRRYPGAIRVKVKVRLLQAVTLGSPSFGLLFWFAQSSHWLSHLLTLTILVLAISDALITFGILLCICLLGSSLHEIVNSLSSSAPNSTFAVDRAQCQCLSVSLRVSQCLSVSLRVSQCLSVSLSVSQSVSVSLSVSQSVSVSLRVSQCLSECLSECLRVSQSHSVFLGVSQCFSVSLSASQSVSVSLRVSKCLRVFLRVSQSVSQSHSVFLSVSQCLSVSLSV